MSLSKQSTPLCLIPGYGVTFLLKHISYEAILED